MAENVTIPGKGMYLGTGGWAARGADGLLYAVFTGKGGTTSYFSGQVLRVLANGTVEWLKLDALPPESIRVTVSVEADAAYVVWGNPGGGSMTRCRIPGFKPRVVGSSVPSNPAPVTPTPVVDQEARDYANRVKNELKGQIAAAESRIAALERRPASGGVSEQQAKDIAWSISADRIYAELVNRKSGVAGQVIAIAKEAVPTREALKALIREVLAETK
jgi:hypothetical protein